MGDKLMSFFEAANKEGGLQAKMRLAMKTGISSAKAADEPDSPENVDKFKKAVKELFNIDM